MHVVVVHSVSAGHAGPLTHWHATADELVYVQALEEHAGFLQNTVGHTTVASFGVLNPGLHPLFATEQVIVAQISVWLQIVGVLTHFPVAGLHAFVLHKSLPGHDTFEAEQKYPSGSGLAVVEKLAWQAAVCDGGTCEHCEAD